MAFVHERLQADRPVRFGAFFNKRIYVPRSLTLATVVRERLELDALPFLERTHREIHTLAGREQDLCCGDGLRQEPAVGADDRERTSANREADEAGVRGVDDPPALDGACRDVEVGLLPAVEQANVALASRMVLVLVAEGRQVSVGV